MRKCGVPAYAVRCLARFKYSCLSGALYLSQGQNVSVSGASCLSQGQIIPVSRGLPVSRKVKMFLSLRGILPLARSNYSRLSVASYFSQGKNVPVSEAVYLVLVHIQTQEHRLAALDRMRR